MTNVQISITVFILAMMVWWNYWYNSPQRVYARQEIIYNSELEELSWSIQEAKRKIESWTIRIQKLKKCIDNKSIVCNVENSTTTGSVIPVPPSKTICTIGTGSHDVRSLAKNYPWVAWWKNNNPSWITLGSKQLEKAFDEAWILWTVWTARPANEWSNYYWFPDLENWMKAKLLIIKRSYKSSTIAQYLRVWGTDGINTHLDTSRTIASLSDDELLLLTRKQIQKESGTLSNYIFNNVIICKSI